MPETPEIRSHASWRLTLLELVLICGALLSLTQLLVIGIRKARAAAQLSQSKNNLRQLALALHNYHDTSNVLPPGGVFNANGVPYHCWSTLIDPYLASSPWYSQVDFTVPWDDASQVDLFKNTRLLYGWENPRAKLRPRPDGLHETSYAGNSWVLYRNSSVTLAQIEDLQNTLLVSEARGNYLPLGCPGNWRAVRAGLNLASDSFGLRAGEVTQVLLADGHVHAFGPVTDPAIWAALRGPGMSPPPPGHEQRPPYPYELSVVPFRAQPRTFIRKAE